MARDRDIDDVSDAAASGGGAPEKGINKSQSGDSGIMANDYSYTASDDDGFDIKTTSDNSFSIAQEAVRISKGDGSSDGIGEQGL